MRYASFLSLLFSAVLAVCMVSSCGGPVNAVGDPHFSADGELLRDSADAGALCPALPSRVRFFVEVSGSMNGFFRSNVPTHFKEDVWRVMSYYRAVAPEVSVLTNDGDTGTTVPQSQFQTLMNTGAFVSTASTRVPLMLQTIIGNYKPEQGEVAVLVSDMKYSPVGAAAPEVLLSQYSTDVSKILGDAGQAVCLVGAVSDYCDKAGAVVCPESPYYYLIMGRSAEVAMVRDQISALLDNERRYVDNIESGMDYGTPACAFGKPSNCCRADFAQPTFVGYDVEEGDTCVVRMRVNLTPYRWIVATDSCFAKAFTLKALHGSQVAVGDVKFDVQTVTGAERKLQRTAIAEVELKVWDMPLDADVVEWKLTPPDTDYARFAPFFDGATSENDPTKSYSVLNFIRGIFYGGVLNRPQAASYILISKME